MKKEDLKIGNVVELRCGNLALWTLYKSFIRLKDGLVIYGNDFNDSLKYCFKQTDFDVIKVYKDYTLKEVLWERKEKPVLTEDEKVILRNVPKDYKWIARDKDDDLCIYIEKPEKDNVVWSNEDDYESFYLFEHLFQSIKWEDTEPYLISELIEE